MPTIEEQLRRTLAADGRTFYRLGLLTGVDQGTLWRFVRRERGLTLTTAAKLAAVLGLELRPAAKRKA
jgi:plasmid maintenance system antidote protein VapI